MSWGFESHHPTATDAQFGIRKLSIEIVTAVIAILFILILIWMV